MTYAADLDYSPPWADLDSSSSASFSNNGSIASASSSFDGRVSVVSSTDNWGECPLSATSSVLTPASMPSTPTHDGRSSYFFWKQYPQMMPTPDSRYFRSNFADASPMVHYETSLGHHHIELGLPEDEKFWRSTPSTFANQGFGSRASGFHMPSGHRISSSPFVVRPTINVKQLSKRDEATAFSPSLDRLPSQDERRMVISNPSEPRTPDRHRLQSPARLGDWKQVDACSTVVPSSIAVDPLQSSFDSGYSSSSPGNPFSSSALMLHGYEDDEDFEGRGLMSSPTTSPYFDEFWNSMEPSHSYVVRSSPLSKDDRKSVKSPSKVRGIVRKKQMRRVVGPDYFKGSLQGTTDSISAFAEPSKNQACDEPGCTARFNRKEHLRRHIRIHKQVKPYPCALPTEICDKWFGRTDNRTQHHATHLKVKPRNKPVDAAFLYECIRKQEGDAEKAAKAIAKLEQRMQQDEMQGRCRTSKVKMDD